MIVADGVEFFWISAGKRDAVDCLATEAQRGDGGFAGRVASPCIRLGLFA